MQKNIKCFAHRGASGYETENTLPSFERAIVLGATWIECDARIVEDRAVIFHDRTLNRMANRPGVIAQQALSDLTSMELTRGGRIPLLSEVIRQLVGRASLQIELKGRNSGRIVAQEVGDALSHGWKPASFLVSSFDHHELHTFKKLQPQIPRGILTYGYPLNYLAIVKDLAPFSAHLDIDHVTQERVITLQNAGYEVYVYTVNEISDLEALVKFGIDGVFSD